jgi:deazaflavin-dependent oxidoreductase (nitroreductase family)
MPRRGARRLVLAAVGLALAARPGGGDEPPLPEVAAALARIRDRSTIDLTTVGRKSGKSHTQPVWFVVDDGRILVQAGKGTRDWYRNLLENPTVVVREGEYQFRTHATPVKDPARTKRIHDLFLHKYTSAWLLSFVGSSIGRGQPVELQPLAVAVLHPR